MRLNKLITIIINFNYDKLVSRYANVIMVIFDKKIGKCYNYLAAKNSRVIIYEDK